MKKKSFSNWRWWIYRVKFSRKTFKKNFSVTALVQYSVDNNFGWLDKIDFKKNKLK